MKKINIDKEVVTLYNNGLGTGNIAKQLNVSRNKIWRTLKENNIEPKRITRPYKNTYNILFFNEYNEYSCYWAGFIMADGNIHTKRKALQIGLNKKDKTHLEKFSKDINFSGPLYYNEKTNSYKLWISGKWFAEKLEENFGILSNKSMITIFPDIPEEFKMCFIRGYFDGDGTITICNKNDVVAFCGTYEMMKYIEKYFYNFEIITKNATGHSAIVKNRSIYTINYSNKNAFKILHLMYNTSNIYLDRKYKKYKKLCQKYML